MKNVSKGKALGMLMASVLLVSACSSNGGAPEAVKADAKASDGKKVQLQMWFWQGASFEKIIPEFNRTHPNIEIVPQIYKWEDAHKSSNSHVGGSGARILR